MVKCQKNKMVQDTMINLAIAVTIAITLVVIAAIVGSIIYHLKKPSQPTGSNLDESPALRGLLARVVTIWALSAVGIIAVVILLPTGLAAAGDSTKAPAFSQLAKDILAILLPVIGTWIGTVLAYYYSKENFEAATTGATNLAQQLSPQQKLATTFARDVMLDIGAPGIIICRLPAG